MSNDKRDNYAIVDITNFASLSEEEQVRRVKALLERLAGPGRIVDHGTRPDREQPAG